MAKKVELFFQMPWDVVTPVLTDPDLGIERIKLSGTIDQRGERVQLFDTTDERLGRAGVVLARRVRNGEHDWCLEAPRWRPWLPDAEYEPEVDDNEVPERFAELIRPFRRNGVLGPVRDQLTHCSEYDFLGLDGQRLAGMRDARVSVRSIGVERFREVTFDPGIMNAAQRDFIASALTEAGGRRVASFPGWAERLGVRAGPSDDLLVPSVLRRDASFGDHLRWLARTRLIDLVRHDLDMRAGVTADTTVVQADLGVILDELTVLGDLLDASRVTPLLNDLGFLVQLAPQQSMNALGEPYLGVLEALVSCAQEPCVDEVSGSPMAVEVLRMRIAEVMGVVRRLCGELDDESAEQDWSVGLEEASRGLTILQLGEPLMSKGAKHTKAMGKALALLVAAQGPQRDPGEAPIGQLSPEEAFAAGRDWQRRTDEAHRARRKFLATWPKLSHDLPAGLVPQTHARQPKALAALRAERFGGRSGSQPEATE